MVEFKTRDDLKQHISDTYGIELKVIEIGKIYQNRITVFSNLAGKEILIAYDYLNWNDKSLGVKLYGIYNIPTFFSTEIYPDRFVKGSTYPCKEIPIEDLTVFGSKEEELDNSCGPNDPMSSLSAKDFACLMLGIPDTNKKWLNSLIRSKTK